MSRILAIDHGDARIGLAITDELGMLAHPLETVHLRDTDPLLRIPELVRERGVSKIVLGMPFRIDGTEGTAVEKVRGFRSELEKQLGGIEIVEVDERLSTVAAQERLHSAGRNARNSKGVIDQAAAVVILEDYLQSQNGMEILDEDDEYWDELDD